MPANAPFAHPEENTKTRVRGYAWRVGALAAWKNRSAGRKIIDEAKRSPPGKSICPRQVPRQGWLLLLSGVLVLLGFTHVFGMFVSVVVLIIMHARLCTW